MFIAPSSDLPATWESVSQLFASADFTAKVLPALLREARWFGGKAHPLREVRTVASESVGDPLAGRLFFIEAIYADRAPETYVLPLQLGAAAPENAQVIARLNGGVLFDALQDGRFRAALFELILRGKNAAADSGIAGICGDALKAAAPQLALALASRALAAEQSNSAIVYGGRFFLKLYRKPEAGENPDAELIRFLSERQHFAHVPAFCGAIEHRRAGESRTLALLVANVPSAGDAWTFALAALARHFARSGEGDEFSERAAQLGRRTAGMHLALAADSADPRFAPEPFTAKDLRTLCVETREASRRTMRLIERTTSRAPEAAALLAREDEIAARLSALAQRKVIATKTRHHGDYHLGQVLNTGDDFVIIDYEGEPARSIAERRMKRSPLRDVAGMLRSFHYAAHTALGSFPNVPAEAAETWTTQVSSAFLDAYLATAKGASFIPDDPASLQMLLDVHLLEKAIYEIDYELNHRPAWLHIPMRGIARILAAGVLRHPDS